MLENAANKPNQQHNRKNEMNTKNQYERGIHVIKFKLSKNWPKKKKIVRSSFCLPSVRSFSSSLQVKALRLQVQVHIMKACQTRDVKLSSFFTVVQLPVYFDRTVSHPPHNSGT